MLGKIVFTIAVIVAVVLFFRHRRARFVDGNGDHSNSDSNSDHEHHERSLSPRALAFILLGALGAAAAFWFAHSRRSRP